MQSDAGNSFSQDSWLAWLVSEFCQTDVAQAEIDKVDSEKLY